MFWLQQVTLAFRVPDLAYLYIVFFFCVPLFFLQPATKHILFKGRISLKY